MDIKMINVELFLVANGQMKISKIHSENRGEDLRWKLDVPAEGKFQMFCPKVEFNFEARTKYETWVKK